VLCALKVKDPGLTLDLLSGVEGVESAEPARILWSLGRTVAASPRLERIFEQGVDDRTWPLLQSEPAAKEFARDFAPRNKCWVWRLVVIRHPAMPCALDLQVGRDCGFHGHLTERFAGV
jgi:hypothetical protein